jgi:rhamnosyltransferase
MNEKTGLLVLTLNGGTVWRRWLDAFAAQEVKPALLLVIDSASSDDSAEEARAAGFSVHTIKREDFRHGDTRRMGVEMLPGAEFIVLMTQDAVLATPDALKALLACFVDERIGAVYGRQLPCPGSGLIAAHSRLFNYPETGTVRTMADVPQFGIKTAFFSNSFSAYRAVPARCGRFRRCIQGEDTYVAARMLLAGWKVALR